MLPYIDLFGREISMYGLSAMAGGLLSLLWARHVGKRCAIPDYDIIFLYVFSVIGCFLGAKLLYLAQNFDMLLEDLPGVSQQPAAVLSKYLRGGFVFYGGLFGIVAGALLACRYCGMNFWQTAQWMLPVIPLIHGCGRVGCFFAGCCYGIPTDGPLGVAFSRSPIAPNGVRLLPVQLFEATALFLLFFLLAACTKRQDGKRCLGLYLIAYAALRFVLEFWRGDTYRGFIGVLSVSQLISLCLLPLGLALLLAGSAATSDMYAKRSAGPLSVKSQQMTGK